MNLTRVFAVWLVLFVGGMSHPSSAQMASFQPMSDLDADKQREMETRLKNLGVPIVGAGFIYAKFDFGEFVLEIIQVKDKYCRRKVCLTFFVSTGAESDERLLATGYFPPRITLADRFWEVCDGCGRAYSVIFEDDQGNQSGVSFTKNFFIAR